MARTRLLMMFLVIANVSLTVWRVGKSAIPTSRSTSQKDVYTFVGADFPPIHPSISLRPASLTLQESVRYGGNESDPTTSKEWNSLTRYPRGLGRAILGPEHREFLVTFYHQLHCIREIEKGLFNRDDPEATPHHMKHCMDYLRQTLLCSALDSLEEGDFMERDFEKQRTGGDLVCWDRELVYKELDSGWVEFTEWRDKQTKKF